MGKESSLNGATTPICRCRVMYLGSSVPRGTKDGLQGIQEPLRDLYPESGRVDYASAGIDSWLSVWSNGILIESVEASRCEVEKFFPIECLHFCSAVRYVVMSSVSDHNTNEMTLTKVSGTLAKVNSPSSQQSITTSSSDTSTGSITPPNKINVNSSTMDNGHDGKNYDKVVKFLPLDSPFFRYADNSHLPLFAAILSRTTGIKVLECHAFICRHESAANALVRCCFHAYADAMYAKQIEENPYCHIGSGASCVGDRSSLASKRSVSVEKLDDNWNDSKQVVLSHHLSDLPLPSTSHHALKTNDHINQISSESDAGFTISQTPDLGNYKMYKMPLHDASLSRRHGYMREGPSNTMRPSRRQPPIHMVQSPTPGGRGGGPLVYPVVLGNHPMTLSVPITTNDRNADKTLKHSLKKQKKKSKSKMDSSLLVRSGPFPLPFPVNYFHMSQMSPHSSSRLYSMHQSLPPPSHQQHYLRNTIYGPFPGTSVPPLLGPAAYSVRTRLKRNHSTKSGTAFGDYSHMFTGPEEEPIYLPTMRPLTPLHGHHSQPKSLHRARHPPQRTNSHYVSYPVSYGTTPRRIEYRSKDEINRNSQSVLGAINGVNRGSDWDEIEREDETERDSSPSAGGLSRRKDHSIERAFSHSISTELGSISKSLASLTIDNAPATQIATGSSGDSGSSRGDDENLHNYHDRSQRHSEPVNDHDSRNGSSSGETKWIQTSSHSSDHFDGQETSNDESYNGLEDSSNDYRAGDQRNEVLIS
uniref:PID domain-containing protein n=1 Tax=Tetranychus urticae TaxID=32264 RepID=T1K019_TETUR